MKIGIIGTGTSGILTALQILKRNLNCELTFFYDSSSPHLHVGESSTQHIQQLIYEVLGVSIHNLFDLNICSYKRGVNFIDWGNGSDFIHDLGNGFGFHFDTVKLNEFIHKTIKERNIATYIDKRIVDYPQEYDFIIDCSGWSSSDDEYDEPIFETVNSAITFRAEIGNNNPLCTLHKATEDGWMFGLPFIREQEIHYGYLYNSKFSNPDLNGKKISWKPKVCKKLIQNDTLAYNGNKLFFIEPLQALSLFYYIACANLIVDYLEGKKKILDINQQYHTEMWTYQISLAFHYQYGSVYDTTFWRYISQKSKEIMSGQWNSGDRMKRNVIYDSITGSDDSKTGIFNWKDLSVLHFGMTGERLV